MKEDEILEEFAELEHEQWTAWSKNIVKTESISCQLPTTKAVGL